MFKNWRWKKLRSTVTCLVWKVSLRRCRRLLRKRKIMRSSCIGSYLRRKNLLTGGRWLLLSFSIRSLTWSICFTWLKPNWLYRYSNSLPPTLKLTALSHSNSLPPTLKFTALSLPDKKKPTRSWAYCRRLTTIWSRKISNSLQLWAKTPLLWSHTKGKNNNSPSLILKLKILLKSKNSMNNSLTNTKNLLTIIKLLPTSSNLLKQLILKTYRKSIMTGRYSMN